MVDLPKEHENYIKIITFATGEIVVVSSNKKWSATFLKGKEIKVLVFDEVYRISKYNNQGVVCVFSTYKLERSFRLIKNGEETRHEIGYTGEGSM